MSEAGAAEGRPHHVLLAVTGSVATIKLKEVIDQLHLQAKGKLPRGIEVRTVASRCALHFVKDEWRDSSFMTDADEWSSWSAKGDPVLHIELRRWADVFVIAPLSANTLAKLANGLCDNLITCVARAWDPKRPFLVFPAMNTLMWEHPFTERHITHLRDLGVQVIPPVSKALACGDVGTGALPPPEDVAARGISCLPLQESRATPD
mmetsp:Transcript_12985/g.31017  ORF Transcript_12985/g.31017 Transcript_12985/m.31017 type:complete len:206 (+) Transcript_12985:61-678(+)